MEVTKQRRPHAEEPLSLVAPVRWRFAGKCARTGFPLAIPGVPPILRQIVRDLVPRGLGADENMGARPDRGGVDQGSHGDMDPFSFADPGIKQRAAAGTVGVVSSVVPENDALVLASDDAELAVLDPGERLEGGAGGAAAVRAVAVHRIGEPVRHLVADRAAVAFAGK